MQTHKQAVSNQFRRFREAAIMQVVVPLDGRLQLGDRILCVQDFIVRGFGPDQVATVLRHTISASLMAASLNPEGINLDEEDAVIQEKSERRPSESIAAESGQDAMGTDVRSVPVRLIVARPAMGNPDELNLAYLEQQKRMSENQLFATLSITPTDQIENFVELLISTTLPIVDFRALQCVNPDNNEVISKEPLVAPTAMDTNIDCVSNSMAGQTVEDVPSSDVERIESFTDYPVGKHIFAIPRLEEGERTSGNNSGDEPWPSLNGRRINGFPILEVSGDESSFDRAKSEEDKMTMDEVETEISRLATPTVREEGDSDTAELTESLNERNNGDADGMVETHNVELQRPPKGGLGLTIVGYIYKRPSDDEDDYGHGIFVQKIVPNSVADRSGIVKVNDQIIQVNDRDIRELDNLQAVSLLKRVENSVRLKLKRHRHGFLYEQLTKAGEKTPPIFNQSYALNNRQGESPGNRLPHHIHAICSNIEGPILLELTENLDQPPECPYCLHTVKPPFLFSEDEEARTNSGTYYRSGAFSNDELSSQHSDELMDLLPDRQLRIISYNQMRPRSPLLDSLETLDEGSILTASSDRLHGEANRGQVHGTCSKLAEIRKLAPKVKDLRRWSTISNPLAYAGDVTPELVELMRRVWQPIVGLDREILVVRFHKPKNASSLGVSLQGITQVPDIPPSTHVPQSDGGKMDENTDQPEWGVPRHFVLSVLPNGPVGKLKVVQPGDELLQVNGRRLHGSSHTSTVRCLRNLPNYIELVLARSISPSSLDQYAPPVDGDRINFDSPPIELIGSEVGSVDTALSADHQDMRVPIRLHQPPNSLSPGTTKRRVSDWIRRSQGDLRPEDNIVGPHADDFIDSARIKRVHSLTLEPRKLAPVTSSPAASRQTESNHTTLGDVSGSLPYDQPQQQLGETKRSGVHRQQSASIRMSDDLTSSTIPIYGTYRRSRDPRYGHKRPVWADVPLLVQLTKSSRGFGFSLSEYEELPVSETDQRVRRKTLTLGRRSSSRRSNYGDRLNRSASLPRSYSRQGKRLGGRGHGVLLIDSLIPGGAAERDGRISVGDRLLFLNDRNLAKSNLREAAAALRAAPNGPCLLGIAKMHLEPNEPEVLPYLPSMIQPITMPSASAVGSFDHSRTSADYDSLTRPLQVNTEGDVLDGYQSNPSAHRDLSFRSLPIIRQQPTAEMLCRKTHSTSQLQLADVDVRLLDAELSTVTASMGIASASASRSLLFYASDRPPNPTPNRAKVTAWECKSTPTDSVDADTRSDTSRLAASLVRRVIEIAQRSLIRRHSSNRDTTSDLEKCSFCSSAEIAWTHSCSSSSRGPRDNPLSASGSSVSAAPLNETTRFDTAVGTVACGLVNSVLHWAIENMTANSEKKSRSSPTSASSLHSPVPSDRDHSLPCDHDRTTSESIADEIAVLFSTTNASATSPPPSDDDVNAADIDLSTTSTVSLSSYLRTRGKSSRSGTDSSSSRPTSPHSVHLLSWPRACHHRVSNNNDRLVTYHHSHCNHGDRSCARSLPIHRSSSSSASFDDRLETLELMGDDLNASDPELVLIHRDIPATDSAQDHPLDFHVLPSVTINFGLHAHQLNVPPVASEEEKSGQIPLLSSPIGIKLDALAAGGQDGCRIIQILDGGAVKQSGLLGVNDYVTSMNGHNMRGITNMEAFQILRLLSLDSQIIDTKFFPAEVILAHRSRFAQKTEEPLIVPVAPNGLITTTTSTTEAADSSAPEFIPPVSLLNHIESREWWLNSEKVILRRKAGEHTWGLQLSGDLPPPLLPNTPLPPLNRPTYIVGIVPGSSAERCECLQPGDMILKVHNVDVWDIGPEKTEQLLTMFAQKNVRDLYLGVRYYTSPSQPVLSPKVVENHRTLIAVDVERRASTTDSAQPSSVGTFHPTPFIDEVKESSPSSSQMETPEPLNEVDSRDELNVLTRSIPSPDNQEGIQTDDDIANISAAKSIAALRCPVVKEDGNVSATEGEFTDGGHTSGDRSSPSAVLPVDPSSPPPVPPRKFSRDQTQGNSDVPPSPVSTSVDPMKFYKRPDKPGDQILRIEITVPRPPPLMGNGSVHSPELVNASASKTDNLGIRLVGSRIPNCPATFVAGFQPDSIAAQHSDLRVGDEIVQVGQTSVVGLNHLTVLRCISQAMHAISTAKLPLSPPDEKKALPQSFCVIVRRNPLNLQMMAAQGPSSQGNSNLQQPTTPTHHVDNRTVITPDPAEDLAPGQPDSSHSVTVDPKFAAQIAQELHESLDDLCLFNVEIPRSKDGFGIFIVNFGPNDEPGVFVNDLAPNGAAAKQGELRPRDRILAVNGSIQTDYDATLRLIQQSSPSVRLTVGRPKLILPLASTEPVATSSPTPSVGKTSPQKTASPSIPFKPIVPGVETLMELVREDGGGLGFSVVGGKDTVLGGILIHEIHEDGVAARDGRLCAGDHLLAANGVDLRNADHKTAIEIIRAAGSRLQLLVYRDPPSKSVSNEAYILVTAVINRKPGQNLGLSLIGRSPYSTGTAIGDVLKESPAAQCKLLEPGDVILEINDRDVRLAQAQEVVALLKDAVGDVRITVGRSKSSDQPALPPAVPRYRLTLYVVVLNHPSTKPQVESEQKPVFSSEFHGAPLLGPTNSEASFGLYVRQATTEEILDAGGLLIVEELQPDSPASRSDMILPGDRLLTVDREPVDWLRPDEVFGVLAELRSCTLELGRLPSRIYQFEPNAMIPEDGSVPLRLPEVIGGVMPAIEPPKGIREMEVLEEEENPESTDFERFLAVKEVEDKNETHSSIVTPSEASSSDIRNAVEMAERGVGGFQMRQVSLPPSPRAPKTPRGWLGVELTKRPTLGLRLTNGPGISGPIVVHVQPGSAAAEAGIHVGDRILGLDNTLILALGSDVQQILEMIETSWLSRPVENNSSSATNGASKPVCLTIISVPLPSKAETDTDPQITTLAQPCPPPPPPRANLPNGLSTSAKLASVPPTSPPIDNDGEITPVPGRTKVASLSSAVSKEELRRKPTKV
ncbi:unnamed protein product [Calicophoron daubneyi]|uniref:PDZ domain-containing protein n=1 Tax=Calicophoron daubneyi TaxID=300641 RepID=A0AAV2TRL9_CALDB